MPSSSDWLPILDEFFKADGGYNNGAEYKSILRKASGRDGNEVVASRDKNSLKSSHWFENLNRIITIKAAWDSPKPKSLKRRILIWPR